MDMIFMDKDLIFGKGTKVKVQDLPDIPKNVCHLTKFEDINIGKVSPDILIGNFKPFVQNSKYGSKLLINEKIPEIEDFKKRYIFFQVIEN
ncbi:hypothetical protein JHK87_043628 [Glycine soja]|nr:hypothetical protein JHK87_043628 [Glycine soja]